MGVVLSCGDYNPLPSWTRSGSGAGKHGLRCAHHLIEDVKGAALVADPRVDAMVTVVPPVLNVAIAEPACAAGKHLLIEKPLATTVRDGAPAPVTSTTARGLWR